MYPTLSSMRVACRGADPDGPGFRRAMAACQQMPDGQMIVRLATGRLELRIIAHELLHAALTVYGESLDDGTLARDVLSVDNETVAHLYDDLLVAVLDNILDKTGGTLPIGP